MRREIVPVIFLAFIGLHCASQEGLTASERAKLDPPLIQLLSGRPGESRLPDVSTRPDGTTEYGVIIRSDRPDDIRNLGITITSVFGDVIVARLTMAELHEVAALSSVRSIGTGSKNTVR